MNSFRLLSRSKQSFPAHSAIHHVRANCCNGLPARQSIRRVITVRLQTNIPFKTSLICKIGAAWEKPTRDPVPAPWKRYKPLKKDLCCERLMRFDIFSVYPGNSVLELPIHPNLPRRLRK
jgi:hypothetical protein